MKFCLWHMKAFCNDLFLHGKMNSLMKHMFEMKNPHLATSYLHVKQFSTTFAMNFGIVGKDHIYP